MTKPRRYTNNRIANSMDKAARGSEMRSNETAEREARVWKPTIAFQLRRLPGEGK